MLFVDGGEAETNIRQRGDVGGSAKKVGKRIKELERIYGIQHGAKEFQGNQYSEVTTNNSVSPKSQEDIAAQMGISVDTLQNYKMMAEMIPELEDLMDTGIVTKVRQCRNLTPIQRIAIAERKRVYYEKKARENQGTRTDLNNNFLTNSSKSYEHKVIPINVRAKLAETAGVSQDTYSKGKKILDSNNEEVKQKVMSGEMSINAGYNKNYCNS